MSEELSELVSAVYVRLEVPNKDGWNLSSFDHYIVNGNYMFYRVFRKFVKNAWIVWEEKPWILIESKDVPEIVGLYNNGKVANEALIALILNRINAREIFPVESDKTLADLIDDCIAAKKGNTNFNLMGYGSIFDYPPWRAEIGNETPLVAHTHSNSEFCAYGDTPEEAVIKLLFYIKSNMRNVEAEAAE